jgi:hypothetical protein
MSAPPWPAASGCSRSIPSPRRCASAASAALWCEVRASYVADAVQSCIVTLEPVAARIEDSVEMLFAPPRPTAEGEVTVDALDDDHAEPLTGDTIDVGEGLSPRTWGLPSTPTRGVQAWSLVASNRSRRTKVRALRPLPRCKTLSQKHSLVAAGALALAAITW